MPIINSSSIVQKGRVVKQTHRFENLGHGYQLMLPTVTAVKLTFLCVCVVYVFHVHLHMCVETNGWHGFFFSHSQPYLFGKVFLIEPGAHRLAGEVQIQGIHLCLPFQHHTQCLHGCWGSELGLSCLLTEAFPQPGNAVIWSVFSASDKVLLSTTHCVLGETGR